jgi:hypothetical protein
MRPREAQLYLINEMWHSLKKNLWMAANSKVRAKLYSTGFMRYVINNLIEDLTNE